MLTCEQNQEDLGGPDPQRPRAHKLEVACLDLGIPYSTGRQLAREGRFPCKVIRVGRSWRVPAEALDTLLAAS